MNRIGTLLLIATAFSSCHRLIKEPHSILESYKQYKVLSKLKSELKNGRLSDNTRDELIAFGEELAPRDSELKLYKAIALRNRGEIARAKQMLEQAIELSPNYSPAISAYGQLLVSYGKKKEGRNYCLYALKLNPIDLAARSCAR